MRECDTSVILMIRIRQQTKGIDPGGTVKIMSSMKKGEGARGTNSKQTCGQRRTIKQTHCEIQTH